jgi:TonB-linked SusC/RagA family outer membrane protein
MMKSRLMKYIVPIILVSLLFNLMLSGQTNEYNLKGRVLNGTGTPVENVSIGVEGVSTKPSFTDKEGFFEILVPSGNVNLIISPADSYHSKEINLLNRDNIIIYLTRLDMESTDDKINTSIDYKTRRNIIASYESYNPESFYYYPYETIDQYFQGNISGMQVTNQSGMPGSGASTLIRGLKSLNTNNQPLYVVDGMPMETFGIFKSELNGFQYNPLTSLEPFDISNITILKDGEGTALYGMQGSNGVILIETLKPTELKTTIDFSYKTGIRFKPQRIIPQLDANQYRTYANEVLLTSDVKEEYFPELYPALFSNEFTDNYHRYKHNTNWQDLIYQNGLMNEVQLRIKGGDEIARYGLSVGYMSKAGVIKSTNYDRLNIRLVGTFNIFKWLRMYVSTHLNTNTSNLIESALSEQTSPVLTSLAKTPMMMPYAFDRDGIQLSVLDDIGSLGISNPYSIFENFKGINRNSHSINSIRLEGDISESFKLKSLFGINLNTLSEDVFMPNYGMAYYYNGTAYNVSKKVKNFLYSSYFDNSISFYPELGNNHGAEMNLGVRLAMYKHELDIGISKNSYENDEYESLQNGVFYLNEIAGATGKWNRLAIYYNLNYNFKQKYLVNFTLSSENSTRLGKNTDLLEIGNVPFATFFNFGGGWRLSSEDFLKNYAWLEDLKLKFSYGISGNDDIGNTNAYNYLILNHYRETSGIVPGNLTDGTLKNETYKTLNAGLDLSLFGNRFYFSGNLYNIVTENMLVFEPQNYYTGFELLPRNHGKIKSQGLELSFNFRAFDQKKFKWDINLNLTPWQKSIVEEVENDMLISQFPGGEFITKTGGSILEFYGYQFAGVYATSEEAETAALKNEKGIPYLAGDAKFADLSGPNGVPDSIINDFDKVSIGSPFPKIYGGFNNTFTYNHWSLGINIYFVLGNDIFNFLRYENEKMTDLSNQSSSVLNRWYYEGHNTDVPKSSWDDPVGNSSFSSRWIEDGSFLRVKNLTLAYTIPNKFLVFRNFKAYVTLNNIITLTNYLGYDPEFSYSFNPLSQGVDYGLIPPTRSFIIGVKVGL